MCETLYESHFGLDLGGSQLIQIRRSIALRGSRPSIAASKASEMSVFKSHRSRDQKVCLRESIARDLVFGSPDRHGGGLDR